MLAYCVEWHLREAWRELLFADEDQAAKLERDPAAPARRSPAAECKVRARTLADGTPVHRLRTIFDELAAQVRDTCRPVGAAEAPTFELSTLVPRPTPRHGTSRSPLPVDRT
jgi:hypothetical protein